MPFLAPFVAVSVSLVASIVPALNIHVGADKPPFPAPQGYVMPWAGGELHAVTQGEETSLTHNGAAAYAFDFDLNYDTVVAARAGKVTMVRQDSNLGGCSALFSGSANYVVVDHGDGTSGLYLHLAQNSAVVRVGDMVDQGQPLAVSGETGLTCSDDYTSPGPHLHFQVQRTQEGRYFTQSLPVAFDDIAKNDGVPVGGGTYMSGNYGRGNQQKIKLTPHRVERTFNPIATPQDPALLEGDPRPVPTPAPPPLDVPPAAPGAPSDGSNQAPPPAPTDAATSTQEASRTPRPTRTPAPAPSDTPQPPAATPTPTPTPARPTETPVPAATSSVETVVPLSTAPPVASSTDPPPGVATPAPAAASATPPPP